MYNIGVSSTGPPAAPVGTDPDGAALDRGDRARAAGRTVASAAFGVVAVVGLLASTLAVWGHRVLFDEAKVADSVEQALDQPAVVRDLAELVATQAVDGIDLERRIEETLPASLERLAPALTGGARLTVADRLEALLSRDDVRAVVRELVVRSHRAAMRVLQGDGLVDGVTVANGAVTVNLLPLVGLGLGVVQDLGLLGSVTVPVLRSDGDPAAQLAELEVALGVTLPEGFGQLVVYEGDAVDSVTAAVASAQRAVVLVKRAVAVVLAVTVASFALSLVCARDRRRAALGLLLGGAAAFAVAHTAIARVVREVPAVAVRPGAREAIAATTGALAEGLLTAAALAVVVGVLAAIAVYLTGPAPVAARLRGSGASAGHSAVGVVRGHRDASAVVAFGLAVGVLVVADLSLLGLVVAAALAVVGVGLLRRPA